MGQSNTKHIHTIFDKSNPTKFNETDLYSELLHSDGNLKQCDFYFVKHIVDNVENVTVFFKFLITTLEKVLTGQHDKYVSDCNVCVKICLLIFPVLQYNYKKKEIFDLMWRENNIENLVCTNYGCNNILILHIFNFLLIILFTENISINSRNQNGHNNYEHAGNIVLAKNTIDIYKLWLVKLVTYEDNAETSNIITTNNRNTTFANSINEDNINNKLDNENKNKEFFENQQDKNGENNKEMDEEINKIDDLSNKNNSLANDSNENNKYIFTNDIKYVEYCEVTDLSNDRKGHDKDMIKYNNTIDLNLINNRINILKCLLILLSSYMYNDNNDYLEEKNMHLYLFTSGDIYFSSNFFISLLNVIYDNEFNYFSFYFYNDTYLEFYNLCIHVLNILTDFNPFILQNDKKVHYINSALDYFFSVKKVTCEGKRQTYNEEDNGKNDENRNKNSEQIDPNQLRSFSNFDSTIYSYSSEESYDSSDSIKESENGENSNKKSKAREAIFNLKRALKIKRNYLSISRENSSENIEDNDYYEYIKNSKKIKNLQTRNIFLVMLQNLELNSIKYIYKGVLNMLISYKLYFENYEEDIFYINNYLCLFWNLMNNNKLLVNYVKNHNSSMFLFYILYILICFNNKRKKEMQLFSDIKKSEPLNGGSRNLNNNGNMDHDGGDEKHMSTIKTEDLNSEKDFYNNERFNQSKKCDEFNIRKIDGLIYICLFIILKLSSNSGVCKNLNQKYNQKIKIKSLIKNVHQFETYVDFLIYALCLLINDNIYFLKFERIIDMAIIILTNISVYIKSMSIYSCECIINILKKILKKEWILSSQYHHYALFLLLDFINNILSHNLNDNYNLVYTIIKNRDVFVSINNLDVTLKDCFIFTPNLDKDYWVPTESWLSNWKNKLPLHFVNAIIYDLASMIEEECDKKEILDYNEVVNLIKTECSIIKNEKIPFIIRKYEKNIFLSKWFTNYIYFLLFFHFYKQNIFINNGIKFIF
ncbi:HID1 domain-containing protein, putative [Plasmodium vinckei lentum]|uniref:HID1 domain-containing protein, putative n=1 Tax=Plasmodium vinckei lentum TaxID=138297 RepID=A0A6V7S6H5_PLAVN|nr:HID1 domain-containing protein, putative [Plasmodium vinckei lentum]